MQEPEATEFSGGEVWRKAIHLLVLIAPITLYFIGRSNALALVMVFAIVAVGCDIWRAKSLWFSRLIERIFGFMMRPSERPASTTDVVFNGATWILISLLLLMILFPFELALQSFSVFVVADAVAAASGLTFGRCRWPGSTSTFEGSLGFFLTAISILILALNFRPFEATLAAAAGTLVEALIPWPNDNVTAPLAIATILWAAAVYF